MQIPFEQERRKTITKLLASSASRTGNTVPQQPAASRNYEYNHYIPIAEQTKHPIFKFLDFQAKIDENRFQRHERFFPKPFMTPNAFLPAYLEVSYQSCTGCFVRFPQVKKDGLMEIPSPYGPIYHEKINMYYTLSGRRRRLAHRKYRLYVSKRRLRT